MKKIEKMIKAGWSKKEIKLELNKEAEKWAQESFDFGMSIPSQGQAK